VTLLQAGQPIVVRVVEQPVRDTSIADVIIGAIGLTGFLLITAAVLGAALGAVLIGIKLFRTRYSTSEPGVFQAPTIVPK
jgi:hypothetical protein